MLPLYALTFVFCIKPVSQSVRYKNFAIFDRILFSEKVRHNGRLVAYCQSLIIVSLSICICSCCFVFNNWNIVLIYHICNMLPLCALAFVFCIKPVSQSVSQSGIKILLYSTAYSALKRLDIMAAFRLYLFPVSTQLAGKWHSHKLWTPAKMCVLLRWQLSLYRPSEDNLTHDIDEEILNAMLKGIICVSWVTAIKLLLG